MWTIKCLTALLIYAAVSLSLLSEEAEYIMQGNITVNDILLLLVHIKKLQTRKCLIQNIENKIRSQKFEISLGSVKLQTCCGQDHTMVMQRREGGGRFGHVSCGEVISLFSLSLFFFLFLRSSK